MANVVNWFEIPVQDFDRAKNFYTKVLGSELHIEEVMGTKMGFFNTQGEGVGGAICAGENYKPTSNGAVIYLNGGDDLQTPLSKVEKAGGKVTLPKTKISDEIGHMAFFFDTEGNKLAFHSQG
jgi:uncharacterized protein